MVQCHFGYAEIAGGFDEIGIVADCVGRKERWMLVEERDRQNEQLEKKEEQLGMENSPLENENLQTHKTKKKRSGFAAGMAVGAAAALLGCALAGVYVNARSRYGALHTAYASNGTVETSSSALEAESKEAIDENLTAKLKVLEQCVDQYFLFDTPDAQTYQDNIYKGFMNALDDPYSCYYTADEYQTLMESTSGSYEGIGVVVSQNVQTKIITVVRPFEGCPGAEAGMLPGDVLIEVAGNDVSDVDVSTVVSWIKGEEGTTVDIRVYRESEQKYYDFTVERKQIEVPTVSYEMLDDNIGYVQVTEFDEVTSDQYIAAVDDLKEQGMEGLIVDIRDNPGGLLDCVVKMLDYMLPEGTLVYTEDKNGEGDTYTSDAEHYFDLPLAVLVNGNSASASEIFSGAIQDYKAGTIVGTQTFGKGIVQSILPFNDGSAIKITVSRYFTPNGVCIHGTGITPDVEVDLDEDLKTKLTIEKDEDNQLQTAIENVKEQIAGE